MDRPALNPAAHSGPNARRFSDPLTTPTEADLYAMAFLSRAQKGGAHPRVILAVVTGYLPIQDIGELTQSALLARRIF